MDHENHILYQGTIGAMEKDLELQVAYHHLGETEQGLNFARQQLDLAREVDIRTYAIVHLENIVET
jgi:hypothetical protein